MKAPSAIILQVRIATGTPIQLAAVQLAATAVCWNAFVEADFNGCRLMAGPQENPDDLVAIYERYQAEPRAPAASRFALALDDVDKLQRIDALLQRGLGFLTDHGSIESGTGASNALVEAWKLVIAVLEHVGVEVPSKRPRS